jgi:hypothetical protein
LEIKQTDRVRSFSRSPPLKNKRRVNTMKAQLFLLPIVLLLAFASRAAVFTNSVSVDAFVRAAVVNSNYGGAGALSVSGPLAVNGAGFTNGAYDTFIRFNTGAMVSNFNSLFGTNNWVINNAKLRVTETGAPANTNFNRGAGSFEIRWIANDNWIEGTGMPNAPTTNGIFYTDETTLLNPATDATLGVFTNAGVDSAQSFSLGLPASFVSDMRAGGEVGLFLTAVSPGVGFTFNARNFTTNSARPFLEVSAIPQPGISAISVSGNDVILDCTNGASGGTYYSLSNTNATDSLNQWQPVATNLLSSFGNFTVTISNAFNPGAPGQQFFILRTQ